MSDNNMIDPETGWWFGECEQCHTGHGGYPPGTLGAELACLRVQASKMMWPYCQLLLARLNRFDSFLAKQRDRAIAQFFSGRT